MGDGMPDLKVGFSVGSGSFPNEGGPCAVVDPASPPSQKHQLDFLFEQSKESFRPAPWSQALAERYAALFKDAQQKAVEAVVPPPVH